MTTELVPGGIPEWTLADRLRKAREAAGISTADFATDLGVSRNTITNYERGHVSPRRGALRLWALRTGVPLVWLETGASNPGDPDGGEGLPRLDSNQQPSD
ncbi:helix-turn-helix transcriptional regulator [Cellulomonas sp. 73-145]|uniref:helix-turn-helix domain-containing protein n=1 Tax=Cellulomonas sp. 73-145 TaxID=1895739 RepID=UPI001AC61430|nr:helix-turn-helix transcriptional regulator [Cellulomonas sp.]